MAFKIIDSTLMKLLLASISVFLCLLNLLFNLIDNNLTNPLLNVKNIVINKVISLIDAPIAVMNDGIDILPLVTEITIKII